MTLELDVCNLLWLKDLTSLSGSDDEPSVGFKKEK